MVLDKWVITRKWIEWRRWIQFPNFFLWGDSRSLQNIPAWLLCPRQRLGLLCYCCQNWPLGIFRTSPGHMGWHLRVLCCRLWSPVGGQQSLSHICMHSLRRKSVMCCWVKGQANNSEQKVFKAHMEHLQNWFHTGPKCKFQQTWRMETTSVIFPDRKAIKLENNSYKITRNISHAWKVGNILLNNSWVIYTSLHLILLTIRNADLHFRNAGAENREWKENIICSDLPK